MMQRPLQALPQQSRSDAMASGTRFLRVPRPLASWFLLPWFLVLWLLAPGVLPAASEQDIDADDYWTLTVVDQGGEPLPGAILLGASSPAAVPRPSRTMTTGGMSPLIIDQRNKRFEPFVSVSSPGRPVRFPNSDDIRHHVYSFSDGNAFERKLYRANDAAPVTFEAEGVVALGCNIHDNMQAYVLVTSESVTDPSDAQGRIRIVGGAPAQSSARLLLWHPLLNTSGEAVAVTSRQTDAGVTTELPLTWSDPQAKRSKGDLESLLRRFSREDP